MLGGVLTGYLLRHKKLGWVQKGITLAIWVLLFELGIAVGNNDMIIHNLDSIGWQALVLSIGGVWGSVLLAWVVYRIFFQSRTRSQEIKVSSKGKQDER